MWRTGLMPLAIALLVASTAVADANMIGPRRLLDLTRAYRYVDQGDELVAASKLEDADKAYAKAAELAPGNLEIQFWHAVSLVTAKQVDQALPIFKQVFSANNAWRTLVPRLVPSGLLPDDKEVLATILAQ